MITARIPRSGLVTTARDEAGASDGLSESAAPPRAQHMLPASPEAVPALRRFATDTARGWRLDEAAVDALALVVSELATNAVLHSGSPDVTLTLVARGTSIVAEVTDSGCWQGGPEPRTAQRDEHAVCGRGLALVRAYSHRLSADLATDGTRMTAEIALTHPHRKVR